MKTRNYLLRFLLHPQKPEDSFFLVTPVAPGVDSDSRQLAALAPSLYR